MQELLVGALRSRRSDIRERWETLLRAERANTPLANPDALVHLIDWTLDEIFRVLQNAPSRRRASPPFSSGDCPCGRNPLLIYFVAGEQALQESLVLTQSANKNLDPLARDAGLNELNLVLAQIARREVEAFCAVCQFREQARAVPIDEGRVPVAHRHE